jgi:hypothetical protein
MIFKKYFKNYMSFLGFCEVCKKDFTDSGKIQKCFCEFSSCKICTDCACTCSNCGQKHCPHGIFYFNPRGFAPPCNSCNLKK